LALGRRDETPFCPLAPNSGAKADIFDGPSRAQEAVSHGSAALVIVRLSHDRRFVGAVLFFFVVVVIFVLFIRIPGRHPNRRACTPLRRSGNFLGDL
jgi:hypothetical protein